MEGLSHSTPGTTLLLVITLLLLVRELQRVGKGFRHVIRRIPGVDAIEGAIGRCAELGRPTVFTTGLTQVGPVLYACLGVLHFIAKKSAQYKLRLIVPQYAPDAMAIVEDVTRDAYIEAGRGSAFEPQNIMFLSDEQFAFASGYQGLVNREKVGAAFLFGSFAAEALVLAEAGQQVGAKQVAASVSPEQVAFFICTCEYTLIGEELFAASAYMSRDPVQVATLAAQDRLKLIFLGVIVVGVLISTANSFFPGLALNTPDKLIYYNWASTAWWK